MKTYSRNTAMFLVVVFVIITGLPSCDNDDGIKTIPLKDGAYSGSFTYDTLVLWEAFFIENNNFSELASGGVWYQKFPVYCLTKGSCKIKDDKIYFEDIRVAQPPHGNIADYDEDYLLMGDYFIENCSDSSITFWRTVNNKKQTYDMELYYENE